MLVEQLKGSFVHFHDQLHSVLLPCNPFTIFILGGTTKNQFLFSFVAMYHVTCCNKTQFALIILFKCLASVVVLYQTVRSNKLSNFLFNIRVIYLVVTVIAHYLQKLVQLL